ncbi:class I SAM-dependent methyltransferase [Flaviaesturariibacter terrae]
MNSLPVTISPVAIGAEKLFLLVPDAGWVQQDFRARQAAGDPSELPYWTRIWPSARALAAWLSEHPGWVRDRTVLELGAGLGLPSLLAARWAASVTGSDYLPDAVALLERNAKQLGLSNYSARIIDWSAPPPGLQADVLLLSDVNYAPAHFQHLLGVVRAFLDRGTTILLATPQRIMGVPFVEALSDWVLETDVTEAHGTAISRYRLGSAR